MSTAGKGHRHTGSHRRTRQVRAARIPGSINGVKYAVRDGAGKIKAALSEATGEVFESLGDVRHAAAGQARDAADDCVQRGRSQVQEAEAAIEKTIRNQPLTSVLIAAGAGFLIGALWRRG